MPKSDPFEATKYETVPSDYKVFEIGHNVAILLNEEDLTNAEVRKNLRYFKIINRKLIARDYRVVTTANLPAAAASRDTSEDTNWKDWLQTSTGTFYALRVGFASSHYTEWEINQGAVVRGGTRGTPQNRFTSDDSPFWNPKLTVYSWEKEFPTFKLYNRSAYTLLFALVSISGYKYTIKEIKPESGNWPPAPVDYIILGDVRSSTG